MMSVSSVRLEGISKRFGGQVALDDVSLDLRPGEVHGLLGHNGSGKSTIVKIMAGVHSPDAGALWMWDRCVKFPLRHASRYGIAVIHQDLGLIEHLSVLENFMLGSMRWGGGVRSISWRTERSTLRRLCDRLGTTLNADAPVLRLRPADKTVLVVVRALRILEEYEAVEHGTLARAMLLLDEPTVYFGAEERTMFGTLLSALADAGVSILLVTHDFRDVSEFTNRVTVLRDGRAVGTEVTSGLTFEDMARLIIGRPVTGDRPAAARGSVAAIPSLEFEGVSGRTVRDLTFTVGRGEVVGITGLGGMGQDEVPYLATAAARPSAGAVRIRHHGDDRSPRAQSRPRLVPANRKREGLWLNGSVKENLVLGRLEAHASRGTISSRSVASAAKALVETYQIKTAGVTSPVWTLSGGNQQKVVLARAFADDPHVVVMHEPVQGVDVGARQQIIGLINDAAVAGVGILVASVDYELLAQTCSRVLVMRDGRLEGELRHDEIAVDRLALMCQGRVAPETAKPVATG